MRSIDIIDRSTTSNNQIGSFNLTKGQRRVVAKAMAVAKQMRQEGEGKAEDAARAYMLMQGAGLDHIMDQAGWAMDEDDRDRQIVAYMDGVAELDEHFPQMECLAHSLVALNRLLGVAPPETLGELPTEAEEGC